MLVANWFGVATVTVPADAASENPEPVYFK
jgi:hypothetical protein